jgi:hypothetical protein
MTLLGWYLGGFVLTFLVHLRGIAEMMKGGYVTTKGEPTRRQFAELAVECFVGALGVCLAWPLAVPWKLYQLQRGWRPKRIALDFGQKLRMPEKDKYLSQFHALEKALLVPLMDPKLVELEPVVAADCLLIMALHAYQAATKELDYEIDVPEEFGKHARYIADSQQARERYAGKGEPST